MPKSMCFVPSCTNTKGNNPDKTFFYVSDCLKKKWCHQANVPYIPKKQYLCCEDHLNLEDDLENYHYWKLMKARPRIKSSASLKLNASEPLCELEEPSELEKLLTRKENVRAKPSAARLRRTSNEVGLPVLGPSADSSSKTCHRDQDSPDSNLFTPDPAQDPLKKDTLDQCRFCGEFRKDYINLTTEHKPYLESYKTSLTVNGLSIELDFNDDTLPKTVCCDCDAKLQEMTDFVKKVIDAQDSLIFLNDIFLNVTDIDTEVVKVEAETTEDNDNEECNDAALELGEVFTHKSERKTESIQKKRKTKQSNNSAWIDHRVATDDDATIAQGNSVSNVTRDNTVFTNFKRKSNVTKENTVFIHKGKVFKMDIPKQRMDTINQQVDDHTVSSHKMRSNVTKENTAKRKLKKIDIPIQRNKLRHDQSGNSQLIDDTQGKHNVTYEDTELIIEIKEEI